MKTDWDVIKTAYVTTDKSLADIAVAFKVREDTVRRHAAKEKWTEARKLWRSKTQQMAAEQRSTELATEITQFDQDCLAAARKGVRIINIELDNAAGQKPPKKATAEEAIEWILARKTAISSFGKALTDYQKAGRLAFGEKVGDGDKTEVDAKGKLIGAIDRIADRLEKTRDTKQS
jgi:hypothetical protein